MIGKSYGRSIAVAGSRGLCVLDLSIGKESNINGIDGFPPFPCSEGYECKTKSSGLGIGLSHPKWRMFNEIEETSFMVKSMVWWERNNVNNGLSEDMILCAVKYSNESSQQYHLAAWSRRR